MRPRGTVGVFRAPRAAGSAVVLVVCVVLTALSGAAGDTTPNVTIAAVRAPGNVFGGQETEFRFRLDGRKPAKGRVSWRLAAGTATVAAGEVAPDAAGTVVIRLPTPRVKDGVVFQTGLTLVVMEGDRTKPAATRGLDVWVFPKDPFAGRADWLTTLRIGLYDPPGATAKVLAAAKVPFEELRTVDAVADRKTGVVVVGEGVSFREERGLAATLDRLAAAGVVVLSLAPAAGELVVPGLGGPRGGQRDLTFHRDFVRELDKRLDPDGWRPDGKTAASTVVVKAGAGGAVGEVVPGGGWPWVEARYEPGTGRWAVCGLAIVAGWDAGPTPRFLFARLLEHLTEANPLKK